MTEFKKYLKQAREEFAYEVSKYTVENNLALRTASDSLLIAFDQATEKAINYTHCCTELKSKKVISFEEWIKHNYREGKHKYYSLNGLNCLSYEEVLQKYNVYKQAL
tara:strand:+ start:513 stop:833 length:321 start_codon:yes stop_codon:yes gene_type:complete